jgi:hypothetical protein
MAIVEAAERHNQAVRHDSLQVATKADKQPELFSGSLIATITHRDALLQRREKSLGRLRAMHWMLLLYPTRRWLAPKPVKSQYWNLCGRAGWLAIIFLRRLRIQSVCDFEATSRAAWAMCQNAPTNMVI